MAGKNDSNRKCFTFKWILENFKYCWHKTTDSLTSPTFVVNSIRRTKWSLSICPRGKESDHWISLYLKREADSKGESRIEIDYELSILASDGSVLTSKTARNHLFLKSNHCGFAEFETRKSVIANQSKFLPQGSLTIRCRIWKSIEEVRKDESCVARTHIGVERKAFLWKIHNFRTFDKDDNRFFVLMSPSDDKPIMSLRLFLRETLKSKDLCIDFVRCGQRIGFSTFNSFLLDAQDNYVKWGEREFWFTPALRSEECSLSLSKDALMDNQSLYLPNNILSLYCEFAFSTGVAFNGIESSTYACSNSFISNNAIPADVESASVEKSDSDTSDLKTDLGTLLQDSILCDVKLCAKSETFLAHWTILSARSPVFRAMFKSDMKEKSEHQIDIDDLTPDTVRRMLLYMYTDSLEELQWDNASDLYVAAEKYQVLSLKDKCSSFLKTNLSLTNACEVLLLADLHQDKELKSTVQNFILENDKTIINSSEWKLLMQANVNLAAETMLLSFK